MEDVRLALDALNRAVHAVQEVPKTDQSRLLGRVLAVARLLKTDAVLAGALKDLEHDALAADAKMIERASSEILNAVEKAFYELGDLYIETGSPWQKIVDAHPDALARVSAPEKLSTVLKRVAGVLGGGAAGLTHADLEPFAANVAPKLLSAIDAAGTPRELKPVVQHLDVLTTLAGQSRRLAQFRRLCATGSIAGIVERTRSLLADWEARIAEGPSGPRWLVPDTNGLEDDLPLVASRIESLLAGRRSRRLVLFRAKAYFEHFYCREVRKVLEEEEARVKELQLAGKEASARRELELRRHLERFIFQEGFFPIAEASAGRGHLDMLIADADTAGIRPLVVEVKQAARIAPDTVKSAEVAAAIAAARGAIPQYVGHLRSRNGWEHVEPFVVVFHTAIEDVSPLGDDNTILIGIGTRTPSNLRVVASSETACESVSQPTA